MKIKSALLTSIAVFWGAGLLSAETSLLLNIAFGFRYVSPSNVTVPIGEDVIVTAPNGIGPNAQWFKDTRPIEGAVYPTLMIPAATASDAGVYVYSVSGLPQQSSTSLILNVGPTQRFVNLSTRASVGSGEQTLIGGFVVSGSNVKTVLIRAIGPSLAKFGINGFLREPVMKIFDSSGNPYTDEFAYPAVVGGGKEAAIAAATEKTGAFPLMTGNKDAVDLRPFPRGAYTVHVVSNDGSPGIALLELYEVP